MAPIRLRARGKSPSGEATGRMTSRDAVLITPYRDGPLLVRGAFELVDVDGSLIESDRATVALCRCGKSRTRPFCDGTHKLIGFRAPAGSEEPQTPVPVPTAWRAPAASSAASCSGARRSGSLRSDLTR